jgi:hypothetical protein
VTFDISGLSQEAREAWEERAAIMQYDGGLRRETAEIQAFLLITNQQENGGTMVAINKNLKDTEAWGDFSPVPAGDYPAKVVDTEAVETLNRDYRLKITWEVTDGQYSGRKVFDSLMLSGSVEAVKVGEARLKAMAIALGHQNPDHIGDSEELHGRECKIVVTIKNDKNGNPKNEISSWRKLDAPAPGQTATSPATPPPNQGQTRMPWEAQQ